MSGQRDELAEPPAPEESVWNALHGTKREQFDNFFECWIKEQERYLQELQAASTDPSLDGGQVRRLISTVVQHYEHYYRNKESYAKHNVTAMFSPSWTSTLEDALLWVGGWRPSTAFHLLYSKSGIEFEAHLESLLRGVAAPDVGHLSLRQLAQVDELQRRIIKEEREITEKQAELQETVANVTMVELSHAVTERRVEPETAAERVETAVESMSEGLKKVLEKADDLRLRTLKDLVDVLNPIQAVHFLTAAAELHLRLHEWGKQRDDASAAAAAAASA